MQRERLLSLLVFSIHSASPALARAPSAPPRRAPAEPSFAYVVPDGAPGEGCDADCLEALAARLRGRPGVRRASVEGSEVALEIQPGVFKPDLVQKGLDGMKLEMRAPYRAIELRFTGSAPFPPASRIEDKILIVDMGEEVKRAVEEAISFELSERMKCTGPLEGREESEALLVRYEVEKRPLASMVPFLAEADLDGDRRADLYLRLEGLPELVIFNKPKGLKAVPVAAMPSILEDIPRCNQTPSRFARPVPKAKVRCSATTPGHSGDAVERVGSDGSRELLMWEAGSAFSTCEPFVEGLLPPPRRAEKPQ
jgi:hypothetical protein